MVTGADEKLNKNLNGKLNIGRCGATKSANPDLLMIVAVVSSQAREFNLRSKLRQNQFEAAKSLASRSVFRPSSKITSALSGETIDDVRLVCVQPMFVISPWSELPKPGADWKQVLRKDEWAKIIAESKKHKDMLIGPAIIDAKTRARELIHVLEWSRHTVPLADHIVSTDTSVHIHWPRMIELFPPPVPKNKSDHALWHLGTGNLGMDALFFEGRRRDEPQECAHMRVAAFSRDLVRQMTSMPFTTQILYALAHPFRMHRPGGTLAHMYNSAGVLFCCCLVNLTRLLCLVGLRNVRARTRNIRRRLDQSAPTPPSRKPTSFTLTQSG